MGKIDCVFCDIGGTLGNYDPVANKLVVFPSTVPLLEVMRSLGLRLGVITTLGALTNTQGRELLDAAGLLTYFDAAAFISEHDVNGATKPAAVIYQYAAQRVNVPIDRCLFIGENLVEVIGATAAGMQSILKP